MNSLNEDDAELKELSEMIDSANKEELKEVFDKGLEIKYDLYKKFLYEFNLFLFKDLHENIKDSVNCLIIGAYIPSITNTNLLLERAIKLTLIQFEAGTESSYDDDEIIKKYIDADKQYAEKKHGIKYSKMS